MRKYLTCESWKENGPERQGEEKHLELSSTPCLIITFVIVSVSIDNMSGSPIRPQYPNTQYTFSCSFSLAKLERMTFAKCCFEYTERIRGNNYRKCREEKNSQVSIMLSWYAVTNTNKTIINSIKNLPRQSIGLPRNVIPPHPKTLDFLICYWLEDTNLQIRAIPASSGLLLILTFLMDGRTRFLHREHLNSLVGFCPCQPRGAQNKCALPKSLSSMPRLLYDSLWLHFWVKSPNGYIHSEG